MNKCIFLDRDGVLNEERGDYTYKLRDFKIIDGVPEAIKKIKLAGYLAVVITNQAGISLGRYTRQQMQACHHFLMEKTDGLIDHIYYAPYHPRFSNSLTRKPDTLMLEKAIAKFDIDITDSWMIGDRERDIDCAIRTGLSTVLINNKNSEKKSVIVSDFEADNLYDAVNKIIRKTIIE